MSKYDDEWFHAQLGPWPAGVRPANPNEIAIVLHEWLDSVPPNPRDPLWREVWFVSIGCEVGPDNSYEEFDFMADFWSLIEPLTDGYNLHERRAEAYKAVQLLQRRH